MDKRQIAMVEEYQCPGCVCGSDISCFEQDIDNENNMACSKHVVGTVISGNIGKIFLGMPKGFNRLGFAERTEISIFGEVENGWGYDFLNLPVWKHLDKNGNTLVRGICPRINMPWIHIFAGNVLEKVDCFEITEDELSGMD